MKLNFLTSDRGNFSIWCRGLEEKSAELSQPSDASERLTSGAYLNIEHVPKFAIPKSSRFFNMGSCFAINLSRAIRKSGYVVLSSGFDHPRSDTLLTKFNTYSMLTELEVALGRRQIADSGLIELRNNGFWDPQLHHADITDFETAVELRARVNRHFSKIVDADVCIITLGLTEMFWDKVNELSLNTSIVDWKHARKTGRFEFRNPRFHEILNNVETLCALIRDATNNRAKVILTVSPVPLQRTFSGKDIIVANSFSKSLLRTVAAMVADNHEFVDYFPAYEFVTLSARQIAWERDQRHVTNAMVDHVISNFIDKYIQ